MMVALEGQQRGLLTKAFWKLMPLATSSLVVCGMYLALRSSLRMSSARMKTMLGLAAGASVPRAVSRAVSRDMQREKTKETSTTSATEADGRAILFIPGTPFERAEESSAI